MSRYNLSGRERKLVERGEVIGKLNTIQEDIYELQSQVEDTSDIYTTRLARAVLTLLDFVIEDAENSIPEDATAPEPSDKCNPEAQAPNPSEE